MNTYGVVTMFSNRTFSFRRDVYFLSILLCEVHAGDEGGEEAALNADGRVAGEGQAGGDEEAAGPQVRPEPRHVAHREQAGEARGYPA